MICFELSAQDKKMMMVLLVLGVSWIVNSQIYEADDSFPEKKENYAWLLEFYAPWCGHCRKLESIYHQVYLDLKGTPIIVAKVDATRYSSLASFYDVRGYPTIKFIQGNKVINYNGERTKESLVEFARKAYGPTVTHIDSQEKFSTVLKQLSSNVFFLYVWESEFTKEEDHNYSLYASVAERYTISSYFFSMHVDELPKNILITTLPTVIVFKDGQHLIFSDKMSKLGDWVNEERYSLVASIGGIGLNEMSTINKLLFIYVNQQQDKLYELVSKVALQAESFSKRYQFVWLKDVDAGRNVIMSYADPPFIFILNMSKHLYYLPSTHVNSLDLIQNFIFEVDKDLKEAYGGKGIIQQLKRLVYNIINTLYSIFEESLLLALLLIVVPLLFLSCICYAMCCMDSNVDDSDEDIAISHDDDFDEKDDYIEQEASMHSTYPKKDQ